MLAPAAEGGAWAGGPTTLLTPAQQREQRQRSVRFLMMFLLMLSLMDGEEAQRQQRRDAQLLRSRLSNESSIDMALYQARQRQDATIQAAARAHPRYSHLVHRNDDVDYHLEVEQWALQRPKKDEFLKPPEEDNKAGSKSIWHYPWNATGVYRGEWTRRNVSSTGPTLSTNQTRVVKPQEIEDEAIEWINGDEIGVVLLPDGVMLEMPNGTDIRNPRDKPPTFLRGASEHQRPANFRVPLEKEYGRVAFQFYARAVPAMHELSIIDGFVKLYDSNSLGYSTGRDVLLRVHGVLIHALGKISLTSAPSMGRSALIIPPTTSTTTVTTNRRLQDIVDEGNIEEIRDAVLTMYPPSDNTADRHSSIASIEPVQHRYLQKDAVNATSSENENNTTTLSDVVFRFPFVHDDSYNSIANIKTPADRSMPPREQLLEANVGDCEFALALNVREEEWTIFEWRKLMVRQIKELDKLHPDFVKPEGKTKKKTKRRPPEDQALVMTLNGTITSERCGFVADLNATAIRTDWEDTTGKAFNYSFCMVLTCLAQIALLLRQLLFTQSQSAATRVSLLCIGWQTVLDAMLCLVHIYQSLAIQPLFTAFASVAFFKLLIFCVIEMKYMAIIIQARNSSNGGGNNVDLLRRRIAMLHLRFYVALMGTLIVFFYTWENYKIIYILVLYSFWVPQIVYNVTTEAKGPLHHQYVYGMTLSRLVAPLYVFAVPNNFLKEIYPESSTNYLLCELLVLWVGMQAALLEAQRRYGARFFIPARFLPPKFDYNRPIPASLLPEDHTREDVATPSESVQKERVATPEIRTPLLSSESTNPRRGARNRMKGSRGVEAVPMTTETISEAPTRSALPSFECAICYNEIDIRNPSGYMLAPCDHLFHQDCLVRWMEVKMECPICRKDLPTL